MKAPKEGITDSHEIAQNRPDWEPTPQQSVALEALAIGMNDADTARLCGVRRETVNRWRHKNPHFKKALAKRRAELWAGVHNRLRALTAPALDYLERALSNPIFGLRAAVHILEVSKLYGIQSDRADE